MKDLIIIVLLSLAGSVIFTKAAYGTVEPQIARWYQNHDGAVSLRFDDSLKSHITDAIPLLNKFGIKATFMVNPGLRRYQAHKDFWEKQVPAMGHRLGNHTMNHRGALDVKDADYEIGEAARLIWRIYPHESKLQVFASGGGGKQWGGKDWEQADQAYRQLREKYHLIDLYDGKHPSLIVYDKKLRISELCERLDRTASEKSFQPFHFHDIGSTSFSNFIKGLVRGQDLTTSVETFTAFLQCIADRQNRLWVAPLVDILKYEEESRGAVIKVIKSEQKSYILALSVQTEPALYDHKLTLVLPSRQGLIVKSVVQNEKVHRVYQRTPNEFLVDVEPVSSTITVRYK